MQIDWMPIIVRFWFFVFSNIKNVKRTEIKTKIKIHNNKKNEHLIFNRFNEFNLCFALIFNRKLLRYNRIRFDTIETIEFRKLYSRLMSVGSWKKKKIEHRFNCFGGMSNIAA